MTLKSETASAALDPVYICHGAEGEQCHVLSFKPEPDSPWANQKFTCHELLGDPGSLIEVDPKFGEYQTLPSAGAALKLHCPPDGLDREMELRLHSEFTAQPLGIALKLGHYRCVFESTRPPIGAPIIGQKVTASVTVHSFYTHAPVESIDVVWAIGDQTVSVPSSSSGVSDFIHTVAKEGRQTITATVYNAYDDSTITEEFAFTGYSSSPWEQARLIVNGNEVEFGDPMVLIRGETNDISVEVPADIAKQLTLELAEATGLTLQATPDFNTPVDPVAGKFSWRISSNDSVSGVVTLVFYSHEVDLPWENRCLVMSDDLSDEVEEILIDGQAYKESGLVLSTDSTYEISLKYVTGSPVANYPLELELELLTLLKPGELTLKSTGSHQWRLESSDKSGTFRLFLKGGQDSVRYRVGEVRGVGRQSALH
jgi:hypothetical protein